MMSLNVIGLHSVETIEMFDGLNWCLWTDLVLCVLLQAQIFDGLEDEDFSFGDDTFVPRRSVKKLVLRKGLGNKSSDSTSFYSEPTGLYTSEGSNVNSPQPITRYVSFSPASCSIQCPEICVIDIFLSHHSSTLFDTTVLFFFASFLLSSFYQSKMQIIQISLLHSTCSFRFSYSGTFLK